MPLALRARVVFRRRPALLQLGRQFGLKMDLPLGLLVLGLHLAAGRLPEGADRGALLVGIEAALRHHLIERHARRRHEGGIAALADRRQHRLRLAALLRPQAHQPLLRPGFVHGLGARRRCVAHRLLIGGDLVGEAAVALPGGGEALLVAAQGVGRGEVAQPRLRADGARQAGVAEVGEHAAGLLAQHAPLEFRRRLLLVPRQRRVLAEQVGDLAALAAEERHRIAVPARIGGGLGIRPQLDLVLAGGKRAGGEIPEHPHFPALLVGTPFDVSIPLVGRALRRRHPVDATQKFELLVGRHRAAGERRQSGAAPAGRRHGVARQQVGSLVLAAPVLLGHAAVVGLLHVDLRRGGGLPLLLHALPIRLGGLRAERQRGLRIQAELLPDHDLGPVVVHPGERRGQLLQRQIRPVRRDSGERLAELLHHHPGAVALDRLILQRLGHRIEAGRQVARLDLELLRLGDVAVEAINAGIELRRQRHRLAQHVGIGLEIRRRPVHPGAQPVQPGDQARQGAVIGFGRFRQPRQRIALLRIGLGQAALRRRLLRGRLRDADRGCLEALQHGDGALRL